MQPINALRMPKIALPTLQVGDWLSSLTSGGATPALSIRSGSVEVLALKGKNVATRVRVPCQGTDDLQLTEAVRQALATAGLKTKRFAVAIPTQDVLFRFFTMPALPKTEWDTAVQFEARKFIPFKTESLIWDYRATPSLTGGRLDVVFAAIQEESYQRLVGALQRAGVQPARIEPRSVSLARLVTAGDPGLAGEFVCVVDVEEHALHLAIVKEGVPFLTRDILLGEPAAAEAGTDAKAQRLISELSVSVDFFMREYAATTVTRVLLFGEETVIAGWQEPLSTALRLPVESGGACVERQVRGLPLTFASALGLAMGAKDAGGLDFLKRSQLRIAPAAATPSFKGLAAGSGKLQPLHVMAGAAVVVLVLAATWFFGEQRLSAQRRHFQQLVAARPDVGARLSGKKAGELKPFQEQAQAQITLLRQVIDERISAALKLDGLAKSLGEGIWLNTVLFDSDFNAAGSPQPKLAVKGACYLLPPEQPLAAIQAFEQRVKKHEGLWRGFTLARLGQIESVTDRESGAEYRTFQLTCGTERSVR